MRLRLSTLLAPAALALALSTSPLGAMQNRIAKDIQDDPAARVPIPHSVDPKARIAQDLGAAPADQKLESLTLRFSPTAAQQAALDQLLLDQQNPRSPKFHQWLTPEQYAASFGLSATDLATTSNWLKSQGFTVTGAARSGTFISFSGTVAQAQKAFGTSIHTLALNGESHTANLTDPTLPPALAAVVTGLTGLNDFKLKARARVRAVKADLKPDFTSSVTGFHFLAPGDFYTIYDVSPLLSSSITGSGVTIAVMGQTDISLADAAAFRTASGLAANPPAVKLYGADPGTSSADIDEAMLDVEWSGAVAPGASILYVNSSDVIGTSLTQAVDNNVAPIMTISYGDCESVWGTTYLNIYNQLFKQANALGITIVGPSGDSGATDCDFSTPANVVSSASNGFAVDFPASSPYVTSAGGSMFNEGSGTYFNTGNNTNSGSAISYIPETAWNDFSVTGGLAAGGGGASAFFTKPAWQTGAGVPNDFARDVPDFAMNASFSHDGYLFCSQGWCTNGYRNSAGNLDVVGGTSVAGPSFSAILALLEQKIGSRIGNANPTLYGLANSTFYNNVFHDITSGNNNSPCTDGTPNCIGVTSIGYNAGPGYDLATGWGSLDAFNLVNDWRLVTPTGVGSTIGTSISSTTVSATTTSVSAGTSPAITVRVASGSSSTSTPAGTVQFLLDNVAVGAAQSLSGGSLTYALGLSATLPSGPHTVSASYSGDSTYAGSKGALQVDVTSATAADFKLTPIVASASASSGGSTSGIPFTVTSVNGFTGAVTFKASVNSNSLTNDTTVSFSVNPVTVTTTAAGATVLTLNAFVSNAHTVVGQDKRASLDLPRPSQPGALPHHRAPWMAAGSGAAFACVLLLSFPRRRRWAALLALILSVTAIGATGCSSNSPVPNSAPVKVNAATGTYLVNVTAKSGSLTHSATLTVTIQ